LQLLGLPEKEGWLIKKGGIGGALTKRWFVLIGPLLFYFSSEQSDSRAKGVVPLYEAEVVPYIVPEKELQKYDKKSQKGGLRIGHCWAVKTRLREFVISCDASNERDEWIAACTINSELQLEEDSANPKLSITMLRKLLWSSDQVRFFFFFSFFLFPFFRCGKSWKKCWAVEETRLWWAGSSIYRPLEPLLPACHLGYLHEKRLSLED
jgi:hypothetical protein